MPEQQKKPKIDLKARLGKKTVTAPAGGAGIPPPVGIPKPPAFGGPGAPMGAAAAQAGAADPYSAVQAAPAPRPVEPQAIKVEMSEEVVEAQKKGRTRIFIGLGVAAFVAGFIGFAFGSGYQRGKGAEVAVAGAHALAKEVDEANLKLGELSEVLEAAGKKLGEGKYPEEEISKLGGINIPFEGANLIGKGIGRFKADLVTMLISYAGGAQEVNDQKEKLQSLFSANRQGITEMLNQKETPKIRWSVFVMHGPHGPWANMQLLPEPFLVKSDKKVKDDKGNEKAYSWPDAFKIKDGGKVHELKRYTGGDPTSGGAAQIIPVAPQTESSVCPDSTVIRLRRELADMQRLLKGTATPGSEKQGLADLGEKLVESLKKIGAPG